jgi:hypothetical protein
MNQYLAKILMDGLVVIDYENAAISMRIDIQNLSFVGGLTQSRERESRSCACLIFLSTPGSSPRPIAATVSGFLCAQPVKHMLDSFGYDGFERNASDFAFDGHRDQSVERSANGKGQTIRIARDDLSCFLTLFQNLRDVRKRRHQGRPQSRKHPWPPLRLEHQCE